MQGPGGGLPEEKEKRRAFRSSDPEKDGEIKGNVISLELERKLQQDLLVFTAASPVPRRVPGTE